MTAAAMRAPSPGPARESTCLPTTSSSGGPGSENFPVASRLLPAALRSDLMALYGWARLVDQLGDDYAGDRLAALDEVERQLRSLRAQPPVTARLERVGRSRGLPSAGRAHGRDCANGSALPLSRCSTWSRRTARTRGCPGTRLRRPRRLLPAVGQPGRARWCSPSSAWPHPSEWPGRTASVRRCSWWSTGRTWPRTPSSGGSTCPWKT